MKRLSPGMGNIGGLAMNFFFQAEDCIRDIGVTGVQTCALPISCVPWPSLSTSVKALVSVLNTLPARSPRSEERRVGKECRSRWSPNTDKKKQYEQQKK